MALEAAPLLPISPRLVRASWMTLGVLTVASLIGVGLAPLLLVKAPLLLVTLAPDGRHVALVASSVDPWLLFGVSVFRRALYSLGVYGLGAAYGDVAVRFVESRARRLGQVLRVLERVFARGGAALLTPLPLLTLCVLAGAARTRLVAFLPTLLLGHCIWVGVTIWLGKRFAASTQLVIDFFAERLFESTLVCVALVAAYQLIRRSKRKVDPPAP